MAQSFLDLPGYPLGLRNNNPGNLRPLSSGKWVGEIDPDDVNDLSRFSDVAYGIRAMITDVVGDIVNDGYNTIRKLITNYAPPSENDTNAYINYVSAQTGLDPDSIIKTDRATIEKLIRAQMNLENGANWAAKITQGDIDEAFSRLSPTAQSWIIPGVAGSAGSILIITGIVLLMRYKRRRK